MDRKEGREHFPLKMIGCPKKELEQKLELYREMGYIIKERLDGMVEIWVENHLVVLIMPT